MLQVTNVSKNFGGLKAVRDCSLEVSEHSIIGLIGPNGAGKTTLFNVIAGVLKPTEGEVWLRDTKISGLPVWSIVGHGLARTFQTPNGFPNLTVLENLMVAPLKQKGDAVFRGTVIGPAVKKEEEAHYQKAIELLDSIGMWERRNELVVNLAAGEARMVELVRQLMLDPQILLLDEPAAGINPALCTRLIKILQRLREQGLTLLVIDHNLGFMMQLCDSIYVLARGEIIAQGPPEQVSRNPTVVEAYLGKPA